MSFVLSSISGNLISAASAGYAPTNSGDVSAIASAYQVVSATATQLYAGMAYLTSVNGTPVSASRAGNAANALLAASAWYDGTGRFISALPDSAAVSAIASAYTTSKQDTLAFAYNTANQISSINGSALGGMDEAAVSGIASAYAQSAASGKLDTSAFSAVSGTFLTAHQDLSDYQTISGMTAYQPTSAMTAYQVSGDYAFNSSLSSKLDASASSNFYGSDNPSSFITGVDLSPYQTTADMSGYMSTSMSSDFQQVTGMSSYVPYSSIGYNTASAISGINGSALAGTTYSAGTGIDITDDVISVEAPVDIVAGPGIVIDNPDGNTLRVSMATDYEVELFSGTAANTNVALNEALDNFERIKIYAYWKGTNTHDYYGYSVTEIYTSELVASRRFTVNVFTNINSDQLYSIANFLVNPTKTQFSLINTRRATFGGQLVSTADGPVIYKVIGIHRIAGGN